MTQIELDNIKKKIGETYYSKIYSAGYQAGYRKGRDDQFWLDQLD